MEYMTVYFTDKGQRNSNQDSLTIKSTEHMGKKFILLAVADGVGGLALGEVASGTVVNDLSKQFENLASSNETLSMKSIITAIKATLQASHEKINAHINECGKKLASTVVLIVIYGKDYVVMNVGDSRSYRYYKDRLMQITQDDSCGDHVLTQCIGANQDMVPHVYEGKIVAGMSFLLCSDGFYGCAEDIELQELLSANCDKDMLKRMLDDYKKRSIDRGEKDNMTAIVFKVDRI